jgi:hypothetical protein
MIFSMNKTQKIDNLGKQEIKKYIEWAMKEQYLAGLADGRQQVQPEMEIRNGRLREKRNKSKGFLLTCGTALLLGALVGLLCS